MSTHGTPQQTQPQADDELQLLREEKQTAVTPNTKKRTRHPISRRELEFLTRTSQPEPEIEDEGGPPRRTVAEKSKEPSFEEVVDMASEMLEKVQSAACAAESYQYMIEARIESMAKHPEEEREPIMLEIKALQEKKIKKIEQAIARCEKAIDFLEEHGPAGCADQFKKEWEVLNEAKVQFTLREQSGDLSTTATSLEPELALDGEGITDDLPSVDPPASNNTPLPPKMLRLVHTETQAWTKEELEDGLAPVLESALYAAMTKSLANPNGEMASTTITATPRYDGLKKRRNVASKKSEGEQKFDIHTFIAAQENGRGFAQEGVHMPKLFNEIVKHWNETGSGHGEEDYKDSAKEIDSLIAEKYDYHLKAITSNTTWGSTFTSFPKSLQSRLILNAMNSNEGNITAEELHLQRAIMNILHAKASGIGSSELPEAAWNDKTSEPPIGVFKRPVPVKILEEDNITVDEFLREYVCMNYAEGKAERGQKEQTDVDMPLVDPNLTTSTSPEKKKTHSQVVAEKRKLDKNAEAVEADAAHTTPIIPDSDIEMDSPSITEEDDEYEDDDDSDGDVDGSLASVLESLKLKPTVEATDSNASEDEFIFDLDPKTGCIVKVPMSSYTGDVVYFDTLSIQAALSKAMTRVGDDGNADDGEEVEFPEPTVANVTAGARATRASAANAATAGGSQMVLRNRPIPVEPFSESSASPPAQTSNSGPAVGNRAARRQAARAASKEAKKGRR